MKIELRGLSADPPMQSVNNQAGRSAAQPPTSASIEWYGEGQARVVEVDGVRVTVRFVGRKGRRARIAIVAAAGAVFRSEAV